MKELQSLASDPAKRGELVADCSALVNSEVKSKGGLGGMAVKAAFAVVKAFKPRIIEDTVDGMLDDFVTELQPFYREYQDAGSPGTLESWLPQRGADVAERLLAITDRRAKASSKQSLTNAYFKLRPKGKEHVTTAIPGVGRVLDKHVGKL
jgi:hypothetical protein